MRLFYALLLQFLVLGAPQAAENAPVTLPLPVEAYGSLPDLGRFEMTPDGSKLAYVMNNQGELTLVIYDLEQRKQQMVAKGDNKEVFLNYFVWANDEDLLISIKDIKYVRGVRFAVTRLFRYSINDEKKLMPVLRTQPGDNEPQFQDNIISLLPDEPEEILMALDYTVVNQPAVYRVNIKSKKRRLIERPRSNVHGWIADEQGKVRIAIGRDETTQFYDLLGDDGRTRLFEFEVFSPETVTIKGFDLDPDVLYFTALHEGRDALFRLRLSDPKREWELVYADDTYDVAGSLVYSSVSGKVAGFTHSNAPDSRVYWDKDLSKLQRSLAAAIPDAFNSILDMSRDGNSYLLYSESKKDSGSYFIGNRKAGSLDYIGSRYPQVDEAHMHETRQISFKAKDGLVIEGYLTLPSNVTANKPMPTIILPHGGPHARDYDGFDYWSQWFAEQGYLVLQPNFRGSSGYGYAFEMAALQQWGKAMQDDLQDAANYLIAEGLADEKRICAVGASYGGYAALMAVVKHPQTFKCAAGFGSVTDLELLVSRSRAFTNHKVVKAQLGSDSDALEASSPISHAEKLSRPVLLIHGGDDEVVNVTHSRDMASALKGAGKDVQYIELEHGDHHLSHQAHRLKTLSAIKAFLDKQLLL
ncbi:alpha/beta hydrolase family protein [Shewanella sedimentimangrovi]|uniref:S9 family peptidase n=1 Tax=Shewanella sedimentimangrovi TaxID=2814293 RepID=A0ABX7R0U6_9GAMM|nr:S9 family peptidase [Shewanella sedimentimangrovi]QSX36486.1 S9 family peptidase [Shewanella sedimentimangrovi]